MSAACEDAGELEPVLPGFAVLPMAAVLPVADVSPMVDVLPGIGMLPSFGVLAVPALPTPVLPALILVVDDLADNRDLLELILHWEGFRTETAATGEEALEAVARQAPDLIILDLMLPGIDGHQVLAHLKGDGATRAIPVIFLSASTDRRDRVRALAAGAEDMLSKPVSRLGLCALLREVLLTRASAAEALQLASST